MTDNTQELDVNKLEQIIADHNKEMRADMASETTGGTRSKAITDVITVKAILGWHNKQVEAVLDRLEGQIKDTLTPNGKHLYVLGDRYNIYSEVEREYDRPPDELPDWENIELKELLEILLLEHIDDINVERGRLSARVARKELEKYE